MPCLPRLARAAATATVTTATVLAAALPALAATGPDVSSWQHPSSGSLSWTQVRSTGATFVFIKATEATTYTNPYFRSDWRASGNAGMYHGAYHFARPSRAAGSAAAQARYFAKVVGSSTTRGTLPPVLDLEVTGGLTPAQLVAWTTSFLTTLAPLVRRTPMIYSYPSFWAHAMAGTKAFRGYPLWGACYCARPTTFGGAWTRWTFWQYTSSATVRGISGKVDMNRFNGTATQLRTLANGGLPRPVGTSPAPTTSSPPPGTSNPTGTSGVGTPAPAPAPAGTPTATAVSLSSPATVAPWTSFAIAGRLATKAGTPLPGRTVHVFGRLVGRTDWIDVSATATDASGRYRFTLRAPASAQIFVGFAGSSGLAPATSHVASITVG